MYEFLTNNSMYVVLVITLLIWAGIIFYMFYLDKKLTKLEIEIETKMEINTGE